MRIFASLLVVTLFITACGSGDDGHDATPTVELSAEQARDLVTFASQEAADGALLDLDDYGAGWSGNVGEDPSEEALPDDFDQQFEDCSGLGPDDDFAGSLAAAESPEYLGPDEQEAETDAVVYATEDEAQAALDLFAGALTDCRQAFIDLAREAAETAAAEDDVPLEELGFNVTFDENTALELADASRIFRMAISFAVADVEVTVDFISLRQGRVTGTFTYSATPNDSERLQLARIFSDKLYRANLSLEPDDE